MNRTVLSQQISILSLVSLASIQGSISAVQNSKDIEYFFCDIDH